MNDAADEIPFAPESATETPPEPQNTPKRTKKQPQKRAKSARPFPAPPRSKQKDHSVQPEPFFAYWNKLPKEFDHRQVTYIQREWPVYNYTLGLTDEQRQEAARNPKALRKFGVKKYITKYIERFETDDWRMELLRRHGSGDYKLYLNDTGEGDLKGATITKTFVQIRDDEYPPVLDRPELLDLEDPANQSYIESLRMRGLPLPGESPQTTREQEEDDMANIAVEKLTDALIETTRRQSTPAAAAAPAPVQPEAERMASLRATEMLADGFVKLSEQQSKAQDPTVFMEKVFQAADRMVPKTTNNDGGNMQMFMTFMQQMIQSEKDRSAQALTSQQEMFRLISKGMDDRLSFMERELQAARAATAPPPPAQPAESEMKFLDKLVSIRDKIDKLTGGNAPDMPGWVPAALQGGEMLIKGATNIMHNLAVMRTGQGTPAAPPDISGEIAAGGEVVEEPENDPMKMYLALIREPLMSALNGGNHGYELAGGIIHQYGYGAYGWITQKGQQGILDLLQQDAGMWGDIQKFGAPRVTTFIAEFLDQAAAQKVADAIRIAQTNAARPAPVKPNGAEQPQGRPIIQPDGTKVNTVHRGPAVVKPE